MKLCHSLRVPVYLGQEHALAAGATQETGSEEQWKTDRETEQS